MSQFEYLEFETPKDISGAFFSFLLAQSQDAHTLGAFWFLFSFFFFCFP